MWVEDIAIRTARELEEWGSMNELIWWQAKAIRKLEECAFMGDRGSSSSSSPFLLHIWPPPEPNRAQWSWVISPSLPTLHIIFTYSGRNYVWVFNRGILCKLGSFLVSISFSPTPYSPMLWYWDDDEAIRCELWLRLSMCLKNLWRLVVSVFFIVCGIWVYH